jgi:hypothetical protein
MTRVRMLLAGIIFFGAVGAVVASKARANIYYYWDGLSYRTVGVDFTCPEVGVGCLKVINGVTQQLYGDCVGGKCKLKLGS